MKVKTTNAILTDSPAGGNKLSQVNKLVFTLMTVCCLHFTVLAVNQSPEAINVRNFPLQNISGLSQILPLAGNDADGLIVSFKVLTIPPAGQGVLKLNGIAINANKVLTPAEAQKLQFEPKNTYTGNAVFTFNVTDNGGLTSLTAATYTIPVVSLNIDLVCTGGALGSNILGTMGTFSSPYIVPHATVSCINNNSIPAAPFLNLGQDHSELTTYTYASTINSLGAEGTYSFLKIIGTMASRNCIKTDWVAADHTGDGGYAMIVNGSPNSAAFGKTFFQANSITVCPNTLYEFSAYIINVLPGTSQYAIAGTEPNISFYINGTIVSKSGAIKYSDNSTGWVPQWIKVGGLWYSGPNTSVNLKIDNATFVANGNDLGLDDISMAICGPEISYPNTDLEPKYCQPGILPLEALVTSSINTYSSYIFERSTDGGANWSTISPPKTGNPVYNISADNYTYTATYGNIPVNSTMNGYKYRLRVATTQANLTGEACNVSAIKVITVSAFTTPSAGADITGCNPATTAQLVAAAPGETWLTVAGNPATATINNSGSISGMTVNGIYQFQLSNTAGCYDNVNVVRDQVENAGPDIHVCAGTTIAKLQDAPAGYRWEPVAGNPINATINSTTGNVSGMTVIGTYHFALISNFGGCTDEVTITINQAITGSASATPIICNGGTATVQIIGTGGTAPLSYTFNETTNNTGIFNGIPAGGNYSWSITDVNNCTPKSGNISITQPSVLVGTVIMQDGTCLGASTGSALAIPTGGVPPYSYSWNTSPAQTSATAINLSAGTYGVTITDFNGCVTMPSGTIIAQDLFPPTFIKPDPFSECVEKLNNAVFNAALVDINPDRPEYYTFLHGDTRLDLNTASFTDNCSLLSCTVAIRWQIDFAPAPSLSPPHSLITQPTITGIGQPSEIIGSILFPGNGVNFTAVIHTITWWIKDCAGNESHPLTQSITINPRPSISN